MKGKLRGMKSDFKSFIVGLIGVLEGCTEIREKLVFE